MGTTYGCKNFDLSSGEFVEMVTDAPIAKLNP